MNCHKKCEKLAANLCGVNQKLIVEALASVRRENQGAYQHPHKRKDLCRSSFTVSYEHSTLKFIAVLDTNHMANDAQKLKQTFASN